MGTATIEVLSTAVSGEPFPSACIVKHRSSVGSVDTLRPRTPASPSHRT